MANIRLEGVDKVRSMLAALGGELEGANKYAQNKMAYELRIVEQAQMRADLDRPTPWSVNSLRYKKAGQSAVEGPRTEGAAVYFETPWGFSSGLGADEWQGVQILGGAPAGPKRSEKRLQQLGWMPKAKVWVPAVGTRLDRYGNVPGSLISDMLSNLGANPYGNKSGTPGADYAKYVLVGDRGDPEGVFRKVGGEWVPFLWFVEREKYQARYDFYGRADREISQRFPAILDYYVQKAIEHIARS
jgi:hypothetical protein